MMLGGLPLYCVMFPGEHWYITVVLCRDNDVLARSSCQTSRGVSNSTERLRFVQTARDLAHHKHLGPDIMLRYSLFRHMQAFHTLHVCYLSLLY